MIEKLIRDGKVAVIIHPDYGSGWSSNAFEDAEMLLFDKEIALAIIHGDFDLAEQINSTKYPDHHFWDFKELKVVWIPVGEEFRIREYDGLESVQLKKHEFYYTA